MAVFRVNKNNNYSTISNHHLREKNMSLKAKGLLTVMLSLRDDWDYSIAGLTSICKESETAIKSTLKELREFGYLNITKLMPDQTESGRIQYVYDIYEQPTHNQEVGKQGIEKQGVENLGVEIQPVENHWQLNTKKSSTYESNTEESSTKKRKPVRHKHGEYQNVLLTAEELSKLKSEFPTDWEERIESLSSYMASVGKTYKDHLATIRNWARREKKEKKEPKKEQSYNDRVGDTEEWLFPEDMGLE